MPRSKHRRKKGVGKAIRNPGRQAHRKAQRIPNWQDLDPFVRFRNEWGVPDYIRANVPDDDAVEHWPSYMVDLILDQVFAWDKDQGITLVPVDVGDIVSKFIEPIEDAPTQPTETDANTALTELERIGFIRRDGKMIHAVFPRQIAV